MHQPAAVACCPRLARVIRSAPALVQILMGGTAVWQRRDVVMGGNLSTEFKLPKAGAPGGKSDTLCSMNAQYNNKGQGQVRTV